MKTSKQMAMLLAVASVGMTACNTDLNILDPNAPTTARAVSNADDVASLIGGSINYWYTSTQDVDPGAALAVMADALTSSYGNFGMRFNSNEPRIAYDNISSSGDAVVANDPWRWNYAALSQANDGLAAIDRGVTIQENGDDVTDEYQAIGHFIQGVSLGNIGLIFDKGFIVDENSAIPGPVEFHPYSEISAAALDKLDQAIALSAGKSWTISPTYITDINMTADKFAALANTYAARTLAYTPRTSAENDAVDWARVKAYAQKGISQAVAPYDFAPIGDGGTVWYDLFKGYADYESWMRVDMRIIKEMDPTQPVEFTSCNNDPPKATSADNRLTTDFKYYPSIPFDPARGCWHFSNWTHERYVDVSYESANTFVGPSPTVLAAENDLLLAEADVRTGTNLGEAATLINKTRVGRGHLTPMTAGDGAAALLAAIQYEQDIELLNTGAGLQYYNRRRIDGLQPQTPLHLPVPATELETDGLPLYTFGGPDHPDH
jgi:hypothetical protein